MAKVSITGDKALDRKLASLSTKGSRRARTAAVKAGMTAVARGIRSEVPVGETKALKKSIGSRVAKAKRGANKGTTQAKAGVNVGKKSGKQAPHSHLVALGTEDRYTGERSWKRKKGGVGKRATGNKRAYRGAMPADDFVSRGFNKSAGTAKTRMLSTLGQTIDKEAKKAAAK
jgi:HK97 gp10 family phage protein